MPVRLIAWVSAVLGLLVVGQAPDQTKGRDRAPSPQRIEAKGIENLFRLSPRLFSGGQPEGEKGFETLKRLSIRTVISVDGSQPDVETARRLGLRYVHLPVGYDGIPRDQTIKMVEAIRELPGPVFVHCHHGMQRLAENNLSVCGYFSAVFSSQHLSLSSQYFGAGLRGHIV